MPPTSSSPPSSAKKIRAKHACRTCNARRVKCNVTEVQPCSNCSSAGVSCEVTPSQRGRYPRRSSKRKAGPSSTLSSPSAITVAAAATGASSSNLSQPPETPGEAPVQLRSAQGRARRDAETPSRSSSPPEPGALFFGESNFLTLVPGSRPRDDISKPHDYGEAHQRQRHVFSVPDTPQSHAHSPAIRGLSSSVTTPRTTAHISESTLRYLREEGALDLPNLETCLPAIKAYFTWFHPCFPVIDRADFIRRLTSSPADISPLLLQAMLFIGATYCDTATISAMGFSDRSDAKRQLYGKARVLFHADWETDRMALIQALFLISFWRGGPSDVRDVRYWLGVVITLAESLGLHRSSSKVMAGRRVDPRLARMRRRIWWSIYMRERQAAASLGLPSRIRDEDCDIEALNLEDMEDEVGGAEIGVGSLGGTHRPEHAAYVVKMVEIARLLGKIIDVQFVPGKRTVTANSIEGLDSSLEAWKNSLPDEMQYSDDGSSSLWTCLLHLAYNHSRILIYRTDFLRLGDGNKSEGVVISAACRIGRIAEDMSAQGLLRYGQMHLITSLFAALCIHSICIRRSTDIGQRIAEHRAQLCLLCLKEVQKYWRINNNVLDLFLHYLDGSIAKRLQTGQNDIPDDVTTDATRAPSSTIAGPAATETSALGAGLMPTTLQTTGGVQTTAEGSSEGRQPVDLFEEQYLNLVNGSWEMDDAQGDLGLFLKGDEFMQEGLGFLGRSL